MHALFWFHFDCFIAKFPCIMKSKFISFRPPVDNIFPPRFRVIRDNALARREAGGCDFTVQLPITEINSANHRHKFLFIEHQTSGLHNFNTGIYFD